jgi:hypothetical protein
MKKYEFTFKYSELMNQYEQMGLFKYVMESFGEFYYEVSDKSEFPSESEYKSFIKHLKNDMRFYKGRYTDDGCSYSYYITKRKFVK